MNSKGWKNEVIFITGFFAVLIFLPSGCVQRQIIQTGNMDIKTIYQVRNAVCAIGYFQETLSKESIDKNYNNRVIIGTGFLIRPEVVITNKHIIEVLKSRNGVQVQDGGFPKDQMFLEFNFATGKNQWKSSFFKIKNIAILQELDVGFIEFVRNSDSAFEQITPLEVRQQSFRISTGLPIGVFGYPYGKDLISVVGDDKKPWFHRFGPILQQGFVSATSPIDGEFIEPDQILLDINFAGGMSGSPVFNKEGLVIGLFYGGLPGITGFALPLSKERVEQWIKACDAERRPQQSEYDGAAQRQYSPESSERTT